MKTLLFVLLSLVSFNAIADVVKKDDFRTRYHDYLVRKATGPQYDMHLNITISSKHINSNREFNEENLGLGLILEKRGKKSVPYVIVGYYHNSLDKTSLYGGYGYKLNTTNYGDFVVQPGVMGGVISGYENPISPMAMLTLSVGFDEIKSTIGYVPRINEDSPAVLTWNVQVKL